MCRVLGCSEGKGGACVRSLDHYGNLPQTSSVCSDFTPDRRRLGILETQDTTVAPCGRTLPVCGVWGLCGSFEDLAGDGNLGRAGGIGGPNEAWS